jgi:hypothetical protein
MRITVGRKTWNTEAVGSKIEVFAIAGCDIMGMWLFFFVPYSF